MAGDSLAYIRRGLSSADLTAAEAANSTNMKYIDTSPNGVGTNGLQLEVLFPATTLDAAKFATITFYEADESAVGSGVPGAFTQIVDTPTITESMKVTPRVYHPKTLHSKRFVSAAASAVTAGSNFSKVMIRAIQDRAYAFYQ